MALDTQLPPLYGDQPIVRNRTKAALNYWAGYVASLPIPPEKPEESWVKQRILAERMTDSPANYVDRAMGYYTQDANVLASMRDLMDGFPTDVEEDGYKITMESSTSQQMGRLAEKDVNDQQAQDWYNENGFGEVVEGQTARKPKKLVVIKLPPSKKAA